MFTTSISANSAQRLTAFFVVLIIFSCAGLIALRTGNPVQANTAEEPEVAPVPETQESYPVVSPENAISERKAPVPLRKPMDPVAIESPGSDPPVRIGGRVEPAYPLFTIQPEYPKLAVTARVEGTVGLTASVTEDGALDGIEVVSGHPLLIGAAIECVRQWKYMPAKLNGTVIRTPIEISVRFVLTRPVLTSGDQER